METKAAITQLKKLIDEEIYVHNRARIHKQEIQRLISEITDAILRDYETQRAYISQILYAYEEATDHVIDILIDRFQTGMEKIKRLPIQPLDLGIWDEDFDLEEVFEKYKPFFEKNMSSVSEVRLSYTIPLIVDSREGGSYLRMLYRTIIYQSVKKNLDGDDVNATMMHLWMARRICRAIGRKELFYYLFSFSLIPYTSTRTINLRGIWPRSVSFVPIETKCRSMAITFPSRFLPAPEVQSQLCTMPIHRG